MFKFIKKILNIKLLFFLNGFLVASILYFKMEDTYECAVFGAIAKNITRDSIGKFDKDTFIVRAITLANSFEHNRLDAFKYKHVDGFKAYFFHPVTIDLMTGQGACGSASAILGRILKAYNYKVRFAQMITSSNKVGHIIIEVKKEENWIVLDPLFNVYFKDSLGNFASFKDVSLHWNYYKNQLPQSYPLEYNYKAVRYTNWQKIPYLGSFVKNCIGFFIGDQAAQEISIRPYLLRSYKLAYWLCMLLFIPILCCTIFLFVKNRNSK
jgi:hypothetical protein